jgi:phosphotransferase system enzyme I (PtsI)
MLKLKGSGIINKIVLGKARLKSDIKIEIENRNIDETEIENELLRFKNGIDFLISDLDNLILNYSTSKTDTDILNTQKIILKDPEFEKKIHNLISNDLLSLESALHTHFTELIDLFENMNNEYFAQRSADYKDVYGRFHKHLKGENDFLSEENLSEYIFIAKDVEPSLMIKLIAKNVAGICLEESNNTAHVAIIAKSAGIPLIYKCKDSMKLINDEDLVILDGNSGDVYVNPDDDVLTTYKILIEKEKKEENVRFEFSRKECFTNDGKRIYIHNNVEFVEELGIAQKSQFDGIGLFRTEFIFLEHSNLPDEEEQFAIYRKVVEKSEGKPITFRTIDIGGDKASKILNISHEKNPNLGLRGIRLALRFESHFRNQLRAILRAGYYGNVGIMFPMISGISELRKAKQILQECKNELREKNILFAENIKVGIMIEVPSAVMIADLLAKEIDFFSFGTNDLIQYLLAVDRDSENVVEYYNPYHPSIIRSLKKVIDAALENDTDVSICGELGSDEGFIPILLGLGIHKLSITPSMTAKVKYQISKLNYEDAKMLASKILKLDTSEQIFMETQLWRRKNEH